jgi:hypothetical protein
MAQDTDWWQTALDRVAEHGYPLGPLTTPVQYYRANPRGKWHTDPACGSMRNPQTVTAAPTQVPAERRCTRCSPAPPSPRAYLEDANSHITTLEDLSRHGAQLTSPDPGVAHLRTTKGLPVRTDTTLWTYSGYLHDWDTWLPLENRSVEIRNWARAKRAEHERQIAAVREALAARADEARREVVISLVRPTVSDTKTSPATSARLLAGAVDRLQRRFHRAGEVWKDTWVRTGEDEAATAAAVAALRLEDEGPTSLAQLNRTAVSTEAGQNLFDALLTAWREDVVTDLKSICSQWSARCREYQEQLAPHGPRLMIVHADSGARHPLLHLTHLAPVSHGAENDYFVLVAEPHLAAWLTAVGTGQRKTRPWEWRGYTGLTRPPVCDLGPAQPGDTNPVFLDTLAKAAGWPSAEEDRETLGRRCADLAQAARAALV